MLGYLLYKDNVVLIGLSRVQVQFHISTLMPITRLI